MSKSELKLNHYPSLLEIIFNSQYLSSIGEKFKWKIVTNKNAEFDITSRPSQISNISNLQEIGHVLFMCSIMFKEFIKDYEGMPQS